MRVRWVGVAIVGCALWGCTDKPTYELPDQLARGVVVPAGCTDRDSPQASLALGDGAEVIRDGDNPFCSVALPGPGLRADWAWLSEPAGDGDGGRPYVKLCLPGPDGDVECHFPVDAELVAWPDDDGVSGSMRLEFLDYVYEGDFAASYECSDAPACG